MLQKMFCRLRQSVFGPLFIAFLLTLGGVGISGCNSSGSGGSGVSGSGK